MNKRFDILSVLAAFILAACFMFCACTSPKPQSGEAGSDAAKTEAAETEEAAETADPTGEATEAPETTDEPADTPAPTEITEGPLSYEAVPFDSEYRCDMNGDGTDEVIMISTETLEDDYDYIYNVSIKSAEGAAAVVEKEDELAHQYEGYAIMLYNSNEGERPALLVCVWHDSDDPTVYAYRVNGDDGEVAVFDKWADFVTPDNGQAFPVNRGFLTLSLRTEFMGTTFVYGDYVVGEEGFVLMSSDYEYAANCPSVPIKNDLPVTISDGDSTYEVKIGAGNTVLPINTDLKTYVYAMFSTGDYGYIYYESDEYPFNINGLPQDHYLDVLYCD